MTSRRLPATTWFLAATLVLLTSCTTTPQAADAPKPAPGNVAPESALARFNIPIPRIHTGGRITADDLPALRAAGIVHIVDLTPDAETPGFDEATAARAAGLAYHNLPIADAADLTPESVAAFDQLLRGIDGPTLVHCASGNRVGALAALRAAWLQGADEEAAIAEGRRWGLRGLEGEVRGRLARERCLAAAQGQGGTAECAVGG